MSDKPAGFPELPRGFKRGQLEWTSRLDGVTGRRPDATEPGKMLRCVGGPCDGRQHSVPDGATHVWLPGPAPQFGQSYLYERSGDVLLYVAPDKDAA